MSDILVIGGGLAGSASAIHLARAGRTVTLIEKETAPHHKVCGEFLSYEAVFYLSALGIDLAALGAVSIDRVSFEGRVRKLPFSAKSLSRCVLDEALLQQAKISGVSVLRGSKAQAIERLNDAWHVKLDNATTLQAPTVFLASGKHDMRGLKRPAGKQNDLVAFKMYWQLQPAQQRALAGTVDLFLFPGGYGGLEPIENGAANLCFLIKRTMLDKLRDWDKVLQHIATNSKPTAEKLLGAKPLWDKPLAITSIPYGYVGRDCSDGLWRLGDQAAVIPSFSGDGMAIALHSARLAAKTYLSGSSATQYQQYLAHGVARQVATATAISRALVNPLGQRLCKFSASIIPRLIGGVAIATRIPEKVLAA